MFPVQKKNFTIAKEFFASINNIAPMNRPGSPTNPVSNPSSLVKLKDICDDQTPVNS